MLKSYYKVKYLHQRKLSQKDRILGKEDVIIFPLIQICCYSSFKVSRTRKITLLFRSDTYWMIKTYNRLIYIS